VTGTFKAELYEKEKGAKAENEKKEGGSEAGDIRVTSLKMVGDKWRDACIGVIDGALNSGRHSSFGFWVRFLRRLQSMLWEMQSAILE
jgi:hypothetical protein